MKLLSSPADVALYEQTPIEQRDIPETTYEAIRRGCEINPEATAIYYFLRGTEYRCDLVPRSRWLRYRLTQFFKDENYSCPYRKITFRELLCRIHQTANFLHALGVRRGDVISYLLPNLPETHFILWGAQAVGIVNPINPLLEAQIIKEILNAAATKVLVTLGNIRDSNIWHKVSTILDDIPSLEHVILIDGSGVAPVATWHYQREVLRHDETALHEEIVPRAGDIAAYFHTGGTTGTPKLAMHSHSNETTNTWLGGTMRSVEPGDYVLIGLPLFHANAALGGGLGVFARGAGIVLATPEGYRSPDVFRHFFDILRTYQIKWFSAVPTVLSRLLKQYEDPVTDLSVEFVSVGAAPVSVELASNFQSRFGIKTLEVYGLTEATALCSMCPQFANSNIGSIGIHLPYVDMRPVKLDDSGSFQDFCRPNEVGILAVRGPSVFVGYLHDLHGKETWIEDFDGTQWLNTGDLGRVDEAGYFWLVGRAKDLIIRGGHNIDPKVIEEAFYLHPMVSLVAAVPRPDEDLGEVPVVYVTLSSPAAVSGAELLSFAANEIPERVAIPKAVHIIDTMPVTAVGKIFKPNLVDREFTHIAESRLADTIAGGHVQNVDCIRRSNGERVIRVKGALTAELRLRIEKQLAFLQAKLDIRA